MNDTKDADKMKNPRAAKKDENEEGEEEERRRSWRRGEATGSGISSLPSSGNKNDKNQNRIK